MAGVQISMWLKQGHWCKRTKAAALHRNAHQLFSVCQCQHIGFTMQPSSSLRPSCSRYRLRQTRRRLPAARPHASNSANMHKCHTHTPIKPIKMHIDPFIKRSTNKISRGRVAVLRGNYLYLCIFLTRWLSHLISFIHCCTNEWSFVLVVDLFSLNNRVFLFDSHRTNASPRKIVMNSCEVRLDLLSIYIHINVLVIPKVAVC